MSRCAACGHTVFTVSSVDISVRPPSIVVTCSRCGATEPAEPGTPAIHTLEIGMERRRDVSCPYCTRPIAVAAFATTNRRARLVGAWCVCGRMVTMSAATLARRTAHA